MTAPLLPLLGREKFIKEHLKNRGLCEDICFKLNYSFRMFAVSSNRA